jgi:hypothetical protein
MIIQVGQLIRMALQDIGTVAKDETVAPDELNDALMKLNFMIDAWSARSLMVMGTLLESFPLTAGTASYTIGVNGDFVTPRPSDVMSAFVRDTYNQDTGIDILTSDEFYSISDKAIGTGRPEALYYDPGVAQQGSFLGVINLYPIPDTSGPYVLFIGEQKALTEFSALTDVVLFQPAYYRAIEWNLAVDLWSQYHPSSVPVSANVEKQAKDSMRVVETMNNKRVTCTMEVPGSSLGGNSYDIYTQSYT